jgi:F-type H+-transporting ATPase subunit gamma
MRWLRFEASIASAITRALSLLSPDRHVPVHNSGRLAVALLCAGQGFAGAFSQRVLAAAGADLASYELFVARTRGAALAERRIKPSWSGRGHPTRRHSQAGHHDRNRPCIPAWQQSIVWKAVFCRWQPGQGIQATRQVLFPLEPVAFPAITNAVAPLLNLPPAALLQALTADYLDAEVCHAALHGFAAENEARMEAMAAGHTQTERQLAALQATRRRVRQEEIAAEIIDLAVGEAASRERAGLAISTARCPATVQPGTEHAPTAVTHPAQHLADSCPIVGLRQSGNRKSAARGDTGRSSFRGFAV